MAIRRRRKKLTSLMSSVDRRLKNVELRQNKGVITAAAAATDSNANNNIITPPSGVTSGNTPNPWVHVVDGYWYPAQLTGAASGYDRVELWFEADPLTEKDYGVTVSGVKVLNENNVSGTFNVLGDDAPRGANRKSWYVALGNTITNSVLYTTQSTSAYNPVSAPTAKQVLSKKLIKQTQANTTTATITFTTSPHYVAGDIISVRDLGSSSSYYGIDGIFKVDSANTTSNTITYTFDTPLANAIPLANVSSKYVYGVAQKQVDVGNTWVNTTDGLTYYWDGIRYVKWTEGALPKDGLAPKPPTSLVLTTTGYNLQGGASGARSRVKLEWTAPTENTDNSPLEDLVGYRIWYRASLSDDWLKFSFGSETTQTIENLAPEVTYYFSVIAYDSSGMESTALTGSVSTAKASLAGGVDTLSAPIVSPPRLGTVTVSWDGKNADGTTTDLNKLAYVEVHASTSSGFTPVSSSASATVTNASGSGSVVTYTTSSAHGFSTGQVVSITGMSPVQYNISNVPITVTSTTQFTVASTATSAAKTVSTVSGSGSVVTYTTSTAHNFYVGQVVTITGVNPSAYNLSNVTIASVPSNTVFTVSSTATGAYVSGGTATPVISSGIARTGTLKGKLYSSTDFLVISDLAYNVQYYFKFIAVDVSGNATSASTQVASTVKPLVDTDLIAASLNAPLLNWPYANAVITAGALASGAVNASNMFGPNVVVQNAIAADAIGANQIAAGAVVAGKLSAYAVTAGTISALAINAGDINTNAITADKINAGAITAVKISANAISADKLQANAVSAEKILVTDTFTYQNSTNAKTIRIGPNSIPSVSDTPGVSLTSGGSTTGWVGLFGASGTALELGTNFSSCYIDMNTSNSMSAYATAMSLGAGGYLTLSAGTEVTINSNAWITGSLTAPSLTNSATIGTPVHWRSSNGVIFAYTSAARFKTNIKDISELDYDKFTKIKIKEYQSKDDIKELGDNAPIIYGYISEELEESGFEKFVIYETDKITGEKRTFSVAYTEMAVATHWAVNIQADKIRALEAKIADLEARISNIESK